MAIRSSAPWTPLLFAAVLLLACRMERTPPPTSEILPEPPVPVGLGPDGEVDRGKLLQVARAQSYDINPGSSHRAIVDYGVDVTIEPVAGAYRNDDDAFDKGVVVARFINHGDSGLSRLGLLPRGTTYWFIYRKGGQLLSAYIPDTESAESDVRGIPTISHPPTRAWRQSVAQWQLPGVLDLKKGMGALGVAAGGQQPWVTCQPQGCCTPPS